MPLPGQERRYMSHNRPGEALESRDDRESLEPTLEASTSAEGLVFTPPAVRTDAGVGGTDFDHRAQLRHRAAHVHDSWVVHSPSGIPEVQRTPFVEPSGAAESPSPQRVVLAPFEAGRDVDSS